VRKRPRHHQTNFGMKVPGSTFQVGHAVRKRARRRLVAGSKALIEFLYQPRPPASSCISTSLSRRSPPRVHRASSCDVLGRAPGAGQIIEGFFFSWENTRFFKAGRKGARFTRVGATARTHAGGSPATGCPCDAALGTGCSRKGVFAQGIASDRGRATRRASAPFVTAPHTRRSSVAPRRLARIGRELATSSSLRPLKYASEI